MKQPKYTTQEQQGKPMSDKGIYMVIENDAKSNQVFWLAIIAIVVLALMCFRLWPMWLKKGIWYVSFYLLVFLAVTAVLRLILWAILYHFGMEFWLFPNYFIDSNDPRDSFWPIYSFEIRDDAVDVASIIFRLASGSLIVYMGYQFCQDEKNIADLKDLAENGISDLWDLGENYVVGNALGDGSTPKKDTNSTEEAKDERSFSQKYKDQLKKDIDAEDDDDLGPDDEVAAETEGEGASTEGETSSETKEPKAEAPEAEEDEDGFVSSADMLNEM